MGKRKPITVWEKPEGYTGQLRVRLDHQQMRAIQRIARRERRWMSDVVRRLLDRGITYYLTNGKFQPNSRGKRAYEYTPEVTRRAS